MGSTPITEQLRVNDKNAKCERYQISSFFCVGNVKIQEVGTYYERVLLLTHINSH